MSLFLDDTPGRLTNMDRAKYAILPRVNCVSAKHRPDLNTLHIVDRDPCPRCGTRRDVGCKHIRRAA